MTFTEVGPFERWDFPESKGLRQVFYRPSDHSYWREANESKSNGWKGSGRLNGVSAAAKVASLSPDGLMDWAEGLGLDGFAELLWRSVEDQPPEQWGEVLSWTADGPTAQARLREEKLTWRYKRQTRADQGSLAHSIFETALTDGLKAAEKAARPLMGDEAGYARAALSFVSERQPETIMAEQVVASDKLNLAGRFDAYVRMEGGYWLLDAKTTKRSTCQRSESFSYQLALYEMLMAEVFPNAEVTRSAVVRLDKDGSYELHPCAATADDALAGLDHLTRVRECGSRLRKLAKAAA